MRKKIAKWTGITIQFYIELAKDIFKRIKKKLSR